MLTNANKAVDIHIGLGFRVSVRVIRVMVMVVRDKAAVRVRIVWSGLQFRVRFKCWG